MLGMQGVPEKGRANGFDKFEGLDLNDYLGRFDDEKIKDLSSVQVLKNKEGGKVSYEISEEKKGFFARLLSNFKKVDNLDLFVVRHANKGSIDKFNTVYKLEKLKDMATNITKGRSHLFSSRKKRAEQVIKWCDEALQNLEAKREQSVRPLEGRKITPLGGRVRELFSKDEEAQPAYMKIIAHNVDIQRMSEEDKKSAYLEMYESLRDYQKLDDLIDLGLPGSAIAGMYTAVNPGEVVPTDEKVLRQFFRGEQV
jgi:hypothetical protein